MNALRTTTGIALAAGGFIPLVSLGNEAKVIPDSADLTPGMIALANEARFTSAHYSEALTQFTVGFRDSENIQATLDYIAPPVPVGRRFEYKVGENSDFFIAPIDDERAIGSGFKRIETKGRTENGKTANRGLTYRLDRDEEGAIVSEERIVSMLQTAILRSKLRRGITVLLALDNAGTAAVFSSATQPDELIRAQVAAAQLASGVFPNRALIGLVAWNYRAAALAPQENAGAAAGYNMTPDQVGQMLGLDSMKLSRELYQSSVAGKTRIMTSNVVVFNGNDGLMKDDPSNIKQFYTPTEGGGRWRVYRQEVGAKFIDFTVEHYDLIVGTSTVGAKKLNVTNT